MASKRASEPACLRRSESQSQSLLSSHRKPCPEASALALENCFPKIFASCSSRSSLGTRWRGRSGNICSGGSRNICSTSLLKLAVQQSSGHRMQELPKAMMMRDSDGGWVIIQHFWNQFQRKGARGCCGKARPTSEAAWCAVEDR